MLGRGDTSKCVRDRPSKGIAHKGMGASWEGEILDSIFEMGSEM